MYATNAFETMILNTFRGQQATAPAALYLGLFLTSPGEAGSGTEVSYAGYSRQQIVFSAPADNQGGGKEIHNSAEITFPTPAVNIGTIQFLGVFNSQVGGTCLLYSPVTDPSETLAGEAPVIVQGEAVWALSGDMSADFAIDVLNLCRGISISGFSPYLAMYNGDPSESGTELSGSDYARPAITFGPPTEQSGGALQIANSAQVNFARSGSAWGTWDHTVVVNASSGGTPVYSLQRTPKSMRRGIRASCAVGAFTLAVN